MLSYSTHGSGGGDTVAKVQASTAVVTEKIAAAKERSESMGDWLLDGEIQFDAAFDPSVAAIKAPDSPLIGAANVFVFPDLSSGNIAYKIAERMGGATAIGPLIQGTRKPFMDLSRGCKVDDIVTMARLVTASLEREMITLPATPYRLVCRRVRKIFTHLESELFDESAARGIFRIDARPYF